MDAFYVSVELRRRPELRGQPVVVGGTGNRGVVAAASYEARRYGVHSALASSIARRRCPHAIFLPGDHELYAEVSRDVHAIFARYTPLIEPLALDEAFLDVSGATRLFGDGIHIAHLIRRDVQAELELSCSVGVAPNKFLAKLASVEAKPHALPDRIEPGLGVVEVRPGEEVAFLHPLPVSRLWGVGPKTLEKLERLGVRTVGDLAALDERIVVGALGRAAGTHLLALARTEDARPVEVDRDPKSIVHEETYPTDVHLASEMRTKIVHLADAVAARLRRAEVGARTLTLKVRYSDGFRTITRSVTVGEPVDEADRIVAALGPIIEEVDPSPGVRLLGVSGSNLGPVFHQLTLDEAATGFEPDATGATLDAIRDRFGADAIGPASASHGGRVRNVKRGGQQWGPDQGGS